jgi:hypothetical protein
MSERSLALFLRGLLEPDGPAAAVGAVASPATFARLGEQPAPALQTLLAAHVHALLATWPGGAALHPASLPAATLWVGAALNNLAWAATRPTPRLLTITLRLVETLPAATTREAALAYHSLLRHLERLELLPADWDAVVSGLLRRSPLTAVWLPRGDVPEAGAWFWELLREPVVWAALRNRWLSLLPLPEQWAQPGITTVQAKASAELGRLLESVGEGGGAVGQPALLGFYEAECWLQRRGTEERPTWPLLRWLHTARGSHDPLVRHNGERVLARYRPLARLLAHEAVVRPYPQLDGRFLEEIGALLVSAKRLRMRKVTDHE